MGIAEFIIGAHWRDLVDPPYVLRADKGCYRQGDRIINIRFAVYYGIGPAIAAMSVRSDRSINIIRTSIALEFDPSLHLRGNGRRKTTGPCPGDRSFRRKIQARRLEAAGLCLALSVRSS